MSFILSDRFSFFFFFHFKFISLLALTSEFHERCFLCSRCSMEMWCLNDTKRDCWGWVGPPTGDRGASASSRKKTERPQTRLWLLCVVVVVFVVVWDAVECVCPLQTARALSYLLIQGVQTWRRGLALIPGIIPLQSCFEQEHKFHHADRIAPFYNQHRKQLNAPHDAISSTPVVDIE